MAAYTLPFEKPVAELEKRLRELVAVSESQRMDVSGEIDKTRQDIVDLRTKIFAGLTQKLDSKSMTDMNYQVDIEHKNPKDVAKAWLQSAGLL